VASIDVPPWVALGGDVPAELVRLAERCRAADGGMPLAPSPGFLRRRWAAPGGGRWRPSSANGRRTRPDGVVPAARGRGLGGALVCEALARMAADGSPEAWLNVNVNNPGAAALYRRLGFADAGRRARYRR
jgi:GNAT superfamily N-acetyltransferase